MAKTKFQLSAGGVIFRENEGIEVALIATKGGTVWGLPKGLVDRERKEPLEDAAMREVRRRRASSVRSWSGLTR